ncbi:MAG: hypothetical protein ACJ757_12065 [Gaiellaceae bacterium]
MALELLGLLVVDGAFLLVGAAALVAAGWLTGDAATWARAGVAFPLGLVIVIVPASYLALVRVPVSWTASLVGLLVIAAAVVGVSRRGWSFSLPARVRARPTTGTAAAAGVALILAVLLAYSARTFAIRPLVEWDAWAVWTAKARLLYVEPSLAPQALRSGNYGQTPYPLGLPTLEALGFSAMGRYDPTLIGVQFILLAISFPIALWALLRNRARSWIIALAALVVVGAPQVLYQLLTHYADVPLGLFVGLGLAAGAAWLVSERPEGWMLACFAAFLGMAGLTKSEGLLFSLAGAAALGVATVLTRERARRLPAAAAIGAMLAVVLPWRLYCAVYGLSTPDYDLAHIGDYAYLRAHTDRVGPVVHELLRQLAATDKWGLLALVIPLMLIAGLAGARWRLLTFAGVWLVLSAAGLLLTYWVSTLPLESNLTNTSYRTIVSLLIGGAALVPLFVFPRGGGERG